MGLLDNQLEKGHGHRTGGRGMFKQRLRQPLPLLCALFLTALLIVSLYTVHGGSDVRDLSFYKFRGDSTSAEADNTIDTSEAEGAAPFSDDRTFESLESVFADTKSSDENSQAGEGDFSTTPYDTSYDMGLGFDNEDTPEYREIFSYSTRDRRFIPLFAEGVGLLNPNLIPHPTKSDMWILIARREMSHRLHDTEEEVVCAAGFFEDVLVCEGTPQAMAINTTVLGQCDGQMARVNEHFGPRDMRVFHGPNAPYVVYGSQSQFTCFGVWLQDARMLLDAFHMDSALSKLFVQPTELRRPGRWKAIEKNFFIFWDKDDQMYVHNDLWPQRSFAKLDMDGSVGEDLAPAVAYEDQVCYAKYMPHVAAQQEWLQQATNALAITLCKREDPGCVPSDTNTFNMHIFHVKSNYAEHRIYEPYVMLFQRTAPFAIHAISQQPLWISGREMLTTESGSVQYEGKTESDIPEGHTERFYMTSVSWRTHGQRYHGYIDDVLFLGFGIEDSRAGAIDVLAGDILQDLAYC